MSTAEHDNTSMLIAWDLLKLKLDPKKWTVSDNFNQRGFFAWGWEARKQYDIPMQTRITELEAQQSDLQEMHNALAANQSIWPNNWCQPIAMIAYHFHLMEAQLADAKKDAERYQWLRREAVELSLSHQVISQFVTNQGELDAAIAEGKQA